MTRAKFKMTLIWLCLLTLAAERMSAQSAGDELFEKKIRPALATNCYGCHSSKLKTPMGGLVLHLLRLDHEKLTYRYAGRDFRLTDVYG